jgi:hypothetical protein
MNSSASHSGHSGRRKSRIRPSRSWSWLAKNLPFVALGSIALGVLVFVIYCYASAAAASRSHPGAPAAPVVVSGGEDNSVNFK